MKELLAVLDEAYELFSSGKARQGIEELFLFLRDSWGETPDEARPSLVKQCQGHPLAQLTCQDPFTCRGLKKPSGYAGDAVLMDMLYYPDRRGSYDGVSPLGVEILRCVLSFPAAVAVRQRRKYAAELIDRAAERKNEPAVLAVAAGHLREAELSEALLGRRIGRFLALDQDEHSLQEMTRSYGILGVQAVKSSIRPFLTGRGRQKYGTFDLIYSIGLYDYLDNLSALKVTERLFRSLNPGGHLMIANFLPGIFEVGYIETFMEWSLIYRTLKELRQVALTVPRDEIASQEVFADKMNTIGYLLLTKGEEQI
jgi:SAM-dependent methyltransferase